MRDEPYQEETLAFIDEGVGGFVLFNGTIDDCVKTIERLRSHQSEPLLLAADCEFGLPMRFPGGTEFTSMMGLGHINNPQTTEEVASAIAREMSSVGLDWNFAPVLDINSNRENPIINIRSFGEDPNLVAEHGAAYIRGMQKNGIIACGKHFPGHGDTSVDSHIGMPMLDVTRERLNRLELVPFYRAMKEHMLSLMLAHLSVPILDPSGLPASLSQKVLKRIREELGYQGVLVTDALDMGAIVTKFGAEEGVVEAFVAGNDVLEVPKHPAEALLALRKGVNDGRIIQETIDDSRKRLQELVQWREEQKKDQELAHALITGASLAKEVARSALKVVSNIDHPEVYASKKSVLILVDEHNAQNARKWCKVLENHGYIHIKLHIAGEQGNSDDIVRWSEGLPTLLVTSVRPRGGAGSVDLNQVQRHVASRINHSESILLNLGNPYMLDQYSFGLRIDTFSASFMSFVAVLEYLNLMQS